MLEDDVHIRPLAPADVPAFLALVDALADYERLPRPEPAARERLARDALASPPRFRVLLAERLGKVVAYALYFDTYSTFLARPTLYLEDLFVLEEERRRGVGERLVRALATHAAERGYGRMDWQVLTWNEPAIRLYKRLGATPLDQWRTYRLTGEQLLRAARREAKP